MSWFAAPCGHVAPISCRECDPPPTNGVTDSQLAVLFRQAQWVLDDAAHDFPAGRVTARRREELAGSLEALGAIVRASTPIEPLTGRWSSGALPPAPGGQLGSTHPRQ
ncbi:MAG: hypothetical protein ACRDTE_17100 [Pseudonocardiaceae bacterium]